MMRFLGICGCLLVVLLGTAEAQNCRRTKANPLNNKTCIAISTSAVTIANANVGRCSLLIINNSLNPIRCTDFDADGNPTATTGTPLGGGGQIAFGQEGQGAWRCIRDTSATADAEVCTAEGLP